MLQITDDVRIQSVSPLVSPQEVMGAYPLLSPAANFIVKTRAAIGDIIQQKQNRLLVVMGPCSIHDPDAALDYATQLKNLRQQYAQELEIVMRVYFEKPRTTVGWKGLINDPHLDDSFDINQGIRLARKLLVDIVNLEIPVGTEFLDTIIPQYLCDLISWGAIGARTTESQIHRELASGLSMPIGFKNGTDGNSQIAVDAIGAAQHPHHFLSVTKDGRVAIVTTKGNEFCHVILRGSRNSTNYDAVSIACDATITSC